MNVANRSGGNLLQPHHRPRLVERTLRPEHGLHQRRLGAGKDIAHLALVLHGGTQGLFDAATVESADGLELVERDDDPAARASASRAGNAKISGARRETSLAERTAGKATATAETPSGAVSSRTSGLVAPIASRSHNRRPRHARLRRQHRLGISFEKRQIGAVATDSGLDRQAPGTLGVGQRSPDERRFAVAPRRDEEHFLPGEQVGAQALELVVAVDEGRLRDDLTVDERVFHRGPPDHSARHYVK